MKQRKKILRKPGAANYPLLVCKRCGGYAAEDSKTELQQYMQYELGSCGVCNLLGQVASPRDFGWPTFYTYESGSPIGVG